MTMNTVKILSALCLAILPLTMQAQKYRLAWEENFSGKEINDEYWSKIPRGSSDWNRHMSYHESLYDVRKGKLVLYGKVNDGIAPEDTARYITGGVYTKGKKNITYGKVEVKARLDGAKGAWPAIWMLPEKGKWPNGGEIDIMERLNYDGFAYQTVHCTTLLYSTRKATRNKVLQARLMPTASMSMPLRYCQTALCSPSTAREHLPTRK